MKRFGIPVLVLFLTAIGSMIIFSLNEDSRDEGMHPTDQA
jgi:hypothetical protein